MKQELDITGRVNDLWTNRNHRLHPGNSCITMQSLSKQQATVLLALFTFSDLSRVEGGGSHYHLNEKKK